MAEKELQMSCGPKNAAGNAPKRMTNVSKTSQVVAEGSSEPISKSSSRKETSKVVASKDSVSTEVLLILKEMNEKLNAQNDRLQKQEEKLETFAFDENYGEQYENEQYGEYPDHDAVSCADLEPHSVFKNLASKFQQNELVDAKVNEDLATFVNSSFRSGITEEKRSDIVKDIWRPQNCDALTKTRVNQGIWRLLKPPTQADDNRMQVIQNIIVKGACNVVKLLDKGAEKLDAQEMDWGSNAVALLGQANKLINLRRKELNKVDLDPKFNYLASASLPYTELLYGDDVDVNKNVREINNMNCIGRNISRGHGFVQRGSYFRGRRPQPYFKRGGVFRGRGNPRRLDEPPKNARMAYKK